MERKTEFDDSDLVSEPLESSLSVSALHHQASQTLERDLVMVHLFSFFFSINLNQFKFEF